MNDNVPRLSRSHVVVIGLGIVAYFLILKLHSILCFSILILVFNIRAWSLLVDLLENCGTFEETKSAYERILDLKISTPETVLNFTEFL